MKECQIIVSQFSEAETTLKEVLVEFYGLKDLSIQDLFREQMRKDDSLATMIKGYLNKEHLIPPSLVNELIKKEIGQAAKGILIRKYPRTAEQFSMLKNMLSEKAYSISAIWWLRLKDPMQLTDLEMRDQYIRKLEEMETFIEGPIRIIEFDYSIGLNKRDLLRRLSEGG